MTKPPNRSRDLNRWAKRMVDVAIDTVEDRTLRPELQCQAQHDFAAVTTHT